MKFKIFGYRGPHNSTERIEAQLKYLGHELSDRPDVVVHLCGLYDNSEGFISSLDYQPKRIYGLLDIDPSKSPSFYKQAIKDLNRADIVTTISETVANEIKCRFNFKNKIEILPFPIRPISNLFWMKSLEFAYVGRVFSANKRFNLIGQVLDLMGVNKNFLAVAGTEQPPYGCYVPNPDDDTLNQFYNSTKFVFLPSSYEGLGLTAIEAVIANAFPILCNDNKVVYELGLSEFATDPNPKSLAIKINKIEADREKYEKILAELRPKFLETYNVQSVTKKLISLAENL